MQQQGTSRKVAVRVRPWAVALAVLTCCLMPAVRGQKQLQDEQVEFAALYSRAKKLAAAGKWKEAANAYEKALTQGKVAFGEGHTNSATVMNNLATMYHYMGHYGRAEALYRRSLKIKEARLGEYHPEVAVTLDNLAILHRDMGKDAKAVPLYRRILKIHEVELGEDHTEVATTLDNLASLYKKMIQYEKAEPLYRRSLKIREAKLGKDHPDVATTLDNLASLYRNMRQYANAEPLSKRSLKICEARWGKDHPSVGMRLYNLAELYHKGMDQYAKAEPLYRRSIRIFEKLGDDHPHLALALKDMGSLYIDMGRYAKAEPLCRRCLEILEGKLGVDHAGLCEGLNTLAILYKKMGQYGKAEPLFRRSLKIQEASGKDQLEVASCLNNLASLYQDMGQYAKAEPLYLRSLAIFEASSKDHDFRLAAPLNNLASLYKYMGHYAKAEPLDRRSLALLEARLGKDHPHVATSLNNLAFLYRGMGQYAKAEPLYRRGLEIREARLGRDHPDVAQSLNNLAELMACQGRPAEATALFNRARRKARRYVAAVLPALSEVEQLTFLRHMERGDLEMALSLGLRYKEEAERNAVTAAWLANGKAQAAESLARSALLARGGSDPQNEKATTELLALRKQLAALALAMPRSGEEERHAQNREELSRQERELSRKLRLAGSGAVAAEWVDLERARLALPRGGVLIDVVRMRVLEHKAKDLAKPWKPERYAAWVTPREGKVQVVDLGEAEAVDGAVAGLRKALGGAATLIREKGEPEAEKALRGQLRKLSDLVLKPLLPHAGMAEDWVVSPDGSLWLVPWQMLLLADGRYAVEKHRISYLNSGRDLAPAPAPKVGLAAPILVADPDYDLAPGEKAGGEVAEQTRAAPRLLEVLRAGGVKRLPGTGAEARAVRPLLLRYAGAKPLVYTRRNAVSAALTQAERPRVAVICTHGFFLPARAEEKVGTGKEGGPASENPLLRCGLLFAGCNRGGGEGVLTGLEVAGVDLRGCEMVVLSACETGLGEVTSGEGVAGLRQAFQVAGARSVVSTLWQVPDRASARLMTLFFENLSKGKSRAEALRAAQLRVIEERREDSAAAHPFFWAAFTLTGR